MECFPKWLVWTLGTALVLAGAQLMILALIGLRNPPLRVRYIRRVDRWPKPPAWTCGVPDCVHRFRIPAWLHAAFRRPWLLRRG
jgi:hypothetical protein